MPTFDEDTTFKPVATLMEKENQRENERILSDTTVTTPISKPFSLRASTPTTVIPNITPVSSMENDGDPRHWETNATLLEDEQDSTVSAFGLLDSLPPSLQEEYHSRNLRADGSSASLECMDEKDSNTVDTTLERRIASAMEQLATRSISSRVGETWMNCSKTSFGPVTMVELLEAAVLDIMDLHDALHERRRVPVDASATNNPVVASVPNSKEEEKPATSPPPSSQEAMIHQLATQKQRIIANLKKKKLLLDDTERKLALTERELQKVSEERNALRLQLENVTESRDSMKNKVRNQQEIVKDARNGVLELKQRLQKTEQMRALENELLDNFRKLAIHTGYYRWGKPIRLLETAIAAAAEEPVGGGTEHGLEREK